MAVHFKINTKIQNRETNERVTFYFDNLALCQLKAYGTTKIEKYGPREYEYR